MVKAGREPRLPQVPLPYLLDYLFEVGPAQSGGLGPAPLTQQELLAWQVNMRRFLQPWEISMLRRLSVLWIDQAMRAEDADCAAPWAGEEVSDAEKAKVADNLRDAMRRMAR